MSSKRIYQDHEVHYRELTVLHWLGGEGYVETTVIEVWNPARPDHRAVLAPEEFYAITDPITTTAAA